MKIAAVTDIHYGDENPSPMRRSDIGNILLRRAVYRINRVIRPDVTVILGDMLDTGTTPNAADRLRELRAIVDGLESTTLVLPGNHDGEVSSFYAAFEKPRDYLDVAGVRFVPFVDAERPDWNAERSKSDLQRMAVARADCHGPIVSLQHTSLHPPGTADCPYNLTNAEQAITRMVQNGITLSISGHYHPGFDVTGPNGTRFLSVPGLTGSPFPLLEIEIDGDRIDVTRHELRMREEHSLFDFHVHSQFAYCSKNMTMRKAVTLAGDFGLAGLAFTEHSGQLLVEEATYWRLRRDAFPGGPTFPDPSANRYAEYLAEYERIRTNETRLGLEVDFDGNGVPLLPAEHAHRFDVLLGAIHGLPELTAETPDIERASQHYLAILEGLAKTDVRVLAHPFRLFHQKGIPADHLYKPIVDILRQAGLAAELNFHINKPPVDFVRLCLETGVPFAFGSDSHYLAEIGEFAPQLQILRDAGFDGDLNDILITP